MITNINDFKISENNGPLTTKSYLNKKGEVLRGVINNIPTMTKTELRKITTNRSFYGAGVAKLAQDQLNRLAKEESKTNENKLEDLPGNPFKQNENKLKKEYPLGLKFINTLNSSTFEEWSKLFERHIEGDDLSYSELEELYQDAEMFYNRLTKK